MEGLSALPLLAGLTLGLAGGAHCALMCGPLCAACVHRPGRDDAWTQLAALQGGRLLGYMLLGVLAGSAGGLLRFGLGDTAWSVARALAALSLLVAGAVLLGWRGPERLAQRALPWWQQRFAGQGRASRLLRRPEATALLGLAWALLPCGLLYAALFLTASSGGAAQGSLTMAAFGLGTLPATAASAIGLMKLRSRGNNRMSRPAGALLASLGALALLAPWLISHDWLGPAAQLLLDCTTPR